MSTHYFRGAEFFCLRSSVAEQSPFKRKCVGSTPTGGIQTNFPYWSRFFDPFPEFNAFHVGVNE